MPTLILGTEAGDILATEDGLWLILEDSGGGDDISGNVFPPGSPIINRMPVSTLLQVRQDMLKFQDNTAWTKTMEAWYGAIINLLGRPITISGLDANLPDATLYPENSRYYATDLPGEYVNIYAVSTDQNSAVWILM